MLRHVVEVKVSAPRRLWLRFDDGFEGELDLSDFVEFRGVFEPLREPEFFRKVYVHPEFGVVTWPNGVDLDSDVLYSRLTGAPLPGQVTLNQPLR